MLLEESLYSFLDADTAIGGMVPDLKNGGSAIYGGIAPQNAPMPRIIYTRISTQRTQSLCGTDPKARAVMQLDCYDRSYKGSKALANAVRLTITDFRGDMAGTHISLITLDTDIDLDDPEPGLFRVSQQYFIWFIEE